MSDTEVKETSLTKKYMPVYAMFGAVATLGLALMLIGLVLWTYGYDYYVYNVNYEEIYRHNWWFLAPGIVLFAMGISSFIFGVGGFFVVLNDHTWENLNRRLTSEGQARDERHQAELDHARLMTQEKIRLRDAQREGEAYDARQRAKEEDEISEESPSWTDLAAREQG